MIFSQCIAACLNEPLRTFIRRREAFCANGTTDFPDEAFEKHYQEWAKTPFKDTFPLICLNKSDLVRQPAWQDGERNVMDLIHHANKNAHEQIYGACKCQRPCRQVSHRF